MLAPPRDPHRERDELELLIREARERQRRRRLGAAAVVAVVSATALGIYAVAARSTAHTAASSFRGAPAVIGPCGVASGWRLGPGPGWSEPTGQHTAPIRLIREGSTTCALRGYPTIVLRDSRGHTIPFRYTHHGDMVVADRSPRTVRLGRHGTAFFVINKYRCDARSTDVARWLVVRLPGVRGVLRLRMKHYPIIDYCSIGGPSTTIAVSPIVGRLVQAAAPLP